MKKNEKDSLACVHEFHTVYSATLKDTPDLSDKTVNDFRIRLLQEELDELKEAIAANDPVEALDALCDLQYVLDGAFLALGFHKLKHAAFAEVHRSNMSKLGRDGKPILREGDGKVLKGPDFTPPDLAQFIETKKVA